MFCISHRRRYFPQKNSSLYGAQVPFFAEKRYCIGRTIFQEEQMDQKKTGAFIAMLRREKGYTQRELADRLELSEKTISKWEFGNGLPEVVYMEPLCSVSISAAVMSA